MAGLLDSVVTVAAVEAEVASMELVAEGDGLFGLVTNVSKFGREPVPNAENDGDEADGYGHADDQRNEVGPTREDNRHTCLRLATTGWGLWWV